jgi:potassium-dependent mechanosensitive channel
LFRFATLVHAVRLALAAAAIAALAPVSQAQQQAPMVGIEPIRTTLGEIETAMRRGGLSLSALTSLTEQLTPLRDELHAKLADLEPRLADIDARLKQLGPGLAKDAPPEDAAVATERTRLTQARAEIDAAVKTAQLLQTRADQLAATLSDRRRAAYAERLLRRSPTVLDPFFWTEVAGAVPDEAGRLVAHARDGWTFAVEKGGATRMALAGLALLGLALAAFVLARWWRRIALVQRIETRFGKAIAAFLVFARAFVLVPAVIMTALELLEQFDLILPEGARISSALVLGVTIAALARAAGLSVLAPDEPHRRLVSSFDDETAIWLHRHLVWSGRFLGALVVGRAVHRTIGGGQPIADALQMAFAFAIGALLVHLLIGQKPREEEDAGQPIHHIPGVRLLAWILVTVIAGALLTGYAALASFIAGRVVFTVELVLTLYLLLLVTDAVIGSTLSPDSKRGRVVAGQLGVNPRRVGLMGALVSGVVRAVFVLVVLALVIGRWEIAAADFFDAIRGATFGVRIGEISISVGAVLGALLLFAIALAITRVVQRWLERDVLPHTAIEPSLRLSIVTVFGYVGFFIAIVLALAELGIDLQKIALVAGALSVGIGFGLQSVVSNFVSGLILLAERPIRVGDQIAVKDEEGFVRRISVRSTEIETFDRANVIIPNSDLITGVVKNWTHTNTLGRILIKVGVGYDSDPEQVRDILAECASSHPQVLKLPAPAVLLAAFGDHALQFEVYCIVADLANRGSIKSDIQFAILKRFRAAGIEIPYPQHDVRIRQNAGADDPETKLA